MFLLTQEPSAKQIDFCEIYIFDFILSRFTTAVNHKQANFVAQKRQVFFNHLNYNWSITKYRRRHLSVFLIYSIAMMMTVRLDRMIIDGISRMAEFAHAIACGTWRRAKIDKSNLWAIAKFLIKWIFVRLLLWSFCDRLWWQNCAEIWTREGKNCGNETWMMFHRMMMLMGKIVFCQIIGTTLRIIEMEHNLIKFADDANDTENIEKVFLQKNLKISLAHLCDDPSSYICSHPIGFFIQSKIHKNFVTFWDILFVWKNICGRSLKCSDWFNICPKVTFDGVSKYNKNSLFTWKTLTNWNDFCR